MRTAFRKFAGQAGWLLSSRLLGAAGQLLLIVILARTSSVDDFGRMMALFGLAQFAIVISDLGYSGHLMRQVAARREPTESVRVNLSSPIRTAVCFFLPLSVVFSISGVALGLGPGLVALAAWGLCERLIETFSTLIIARQEAHRIVLATIMRRFGAVALFLAFGVAFGAPLAFSLAISLASTAALLVTHAGVRAVLTPEFSGFKDFGSTVRDWPQLRHFYGLSVFTQVRSLDVLLVGVVAGPAMAGLYAIPARLFLPVLMLPSSLAQASLPFFARTGTSRVPNYTRILLLFVTGCSAPLAILFALAPEVVELFGTQYTPAISAVRIFCVGMIFVSGLQLVNVYCQARGLVRIAQNAAFFSSSVLMAGISIAATSTSLNAIAATAAGVSLLHFLVLAEVTRRDALQGR